MIKLLFVFSLALISFVQLQAQINISCNYRETCLYNEETEKFDICDKEEENSLFKINADMSVITHTTETIKSAYYVEKQSTDQETGIIELTVVSDVGNEYVYFIDIENKEVRIAAKSDGQIILIRFYIKKAWETK